MPTSESKNIAIVEGAGTLVVDVTIAAWVIVYEPGSAKETPVTNAVGSVGSNIRSSLIPVRVNVETGKGKSNGKTGEWNQ